MARHSTLSPGRSLVSSSLCSGPRLQARGAEGKQQRQQEETSPGKLSVGGGENASVRTLCDLILVHRELSFRSQLVAAFAHVMGNSRQQQDSRQREYFRL